MKMTILIMLGAIAPCACASSNEPAHDPADVSYAPRPASDASRHSENSARYDDRSGPVDQTDTNAAANTGTGPASGVGTTPTPPSNASNEAATMSSAPPPPPAAAAGSQPDNTRVNKRDTAPGAPTPMDQGNGSSDLKITQQIRQAVVADGSLSFTAKNVKIITQNGKVTLRGPVKTDQERSAIEASARKVAGDSNVDNQLEVKK
jgi:hyperosmotically inducible protein